MTTAPGDFQCIACGKQFKWQAHLAGRKVRCPCRAVMEYPHRPPSSPTDSAEIHREPEDELYDIAPDVPEARRTRVTAEQSPPQSPAPNQDPVKPVLGYRSPTLAKPAKDLDVDRLKKLTGPLWIFGAGLTVELLVTLWQARINPGTAMMYLLLGVFLGSAAKMGGLLIAAKLRQINIGSFGTALLRLAAVSVAPAAVGALLSPLTMFIPLGFLALLVVEFALYFALLGMFFDLDESDTWLCVWVIFLINVAIYFALPHFLG